MGSAPIAVGSKLKTATTVVSKWRVFDAHGMVLVEFGDPFIGVSDVQHQCLSMAVEHLLRTCAGTLRREHASSQGFRSVFRRPRFGSPSQNASSKWDTGQTGMRSRTTVTHAGVMGVYFALKRDRS